jgi:hypothetical protein
MLALVALVLSLVSNTASAQQKGVELRGTTYLSLPEKQFGGPTTDAVIRIGQINVQGDTFDLTGEVSYNSAAYPLHLTGNFYKSGIGSSEDEVITAQDAGGTFAVVHAALRRDPAPEVLLVN